MANKRERQSAILEIVNSRIVSSQEDLRKLLLHRGWDVTQATLSRDLRELRLARVPTPEGARYAVTDGTIEESRVALETLLPQLFLRIDGVSDMIVLRTVPGGAQPVRSDQPAAEHDDRAEHGDGARARRVRLPGTTALDPYRCTIEEHPCDHAVCVAACSCCARKNCRASESVMGMSAWRSIIVSAPA